MQSRTTSARKGNGRTDEENRLYAMAGAAGQTRQSRLQRVEDMKAGRRRKAEQRVLAINPSLSGDELARAVDEDLRTQLVRARAAALTARRKAAEAAERATAAEAALAEVMAADSSVA